MNLSSHPPSPAPSRAGRLAALAAAACLTTLPAHALVWVQSDAFDPLTKKGAHRDTRDDAALAAAASVFAQTWVTSNGQGAGNMGTGGLPNCSLLNCIYSDMAYAGGAANGNTGWLKSYAGAVAQGVSWSSVGLADTLGWNAGGITLHFDLRIDQYGSHAEGLGTYTYRAARATGDVDQPLEDFLRLDVEAGGAWQLLLDGSPTASGDNFSGQLTLDYHLGGPVAGSAALVFLLDTTADCQAWSGDVNHLCSALMQAAQSSYLSIDGPYTSASGYQYLGDLGASTVPEPNGALLAACGLIGVFGLSRRRTPGGHR